MLPATEPHAAPRRGQPQVEGLSLAIWSGFALWILLDEKHRVVSPTLHGNTESQKTCTRDYGQICPIMDVHLIKKNFVEKRRRHPRRQPRSGGAEVEARSNAPPQTTVIQVCMY